MKLFCKSLYPLPVIPALLLFPPRLEGGEFMDTWITFGLYDDNVFAGAEDRSPAAGLYQIDDEAFFDNYDTRQTGDETETHFVLYRKMPSFFKGLVTEVSLVGRILFYADPETGEFMERLEDDGTYINLIYYPGKEEKGDYFSLTAFPFDSERFLLGYSYDITWGGETSFPGNYYPVPGLKLYYRFREGEVPGGYIFAGAKSSRLLDESINEVETYWGYLSGFGLDLSGHLRWEVNAGAFQKGVFPPLGQTDEYGNDPIAGLPVWSYGASTQLTYHRGIPIGYSVDFRLYREDPEWVIKITGPEEYGPGLSYLISSEFSYLVESLVSWEDFGTTAWQEGIAGDLNLKLKWNYFRFTLDTVFRDLGFILFDVPGMTPYYTFPDNAEVGYEWFFAAGFDYYIKRIHFTPGIIGGIQHPATYRGMNPLGESYESSVIVIKKEGDVEILPQGEEALDIYSIRGTGKLQISDFLFFIFELTYTLDRNATKYVDTGDGVATRVWDDPWVQNQMGFAGILQARF